MKLFSKQNPASRSDARSIPLLAGVGGQGGGADGKEKKGGEGHPSLIVRGTTYFFSIQGDANARSNFADMLFEDEQPFNKFYGLCIEKLKAIDLRDASNLLIREPRKHPQVISGNMRQLYSNHHHFALHKNQYNALRKEPEFSEVFATEFESLTKMPFAQYESEFLSQLPTLSSPKDNSACCGSGCW